ncbi:6796_t:CDS:2, partial [Cetraspora pellucida]
QDKKLSENILISQDKKLSEDILTFNNFEINDKVFDIKDSESDYDIFDDNTSFITVTESLSSKGATVNESIEIQPFIWDEEDLEHEPSETASFVTESTETQLLGTWEIDSDAFELVKKDNKLYTLGVWRLYFTFDQTELHNAKLKKRIVQAPCMGLKTCPAIENYSNINYNKKYQPRYICNQCFNLQGGHFFQCLGINKKPELCNNKHDDNTTQMLELLGQFILNIAASNKTKQKKELLTYLSSMLPFFDKTKLYIKNPLSLLFVKAAL